MYLFQEIRNGIHIRKSDITRRKEKVECYSKKLCLYFAIVKAAGKTKQNKTKTWKYCRRSKNAINKFDQLDVYRLLQESMHIDDILGYKGSLNIFPSTKIIKSLPPFQRRKKLEINK